MGWAIPPTAQFYGLEGLDEAARYLAHPVLGARLAEMCELILAHEGRAPQDILGGIDAIKLQSCATLFAALPGAGDVFGRVLDAFYEGARCPRTLAAILDAGRG